MPHTADAFIVLTNQHHSYYRCCCIIFLFFSACASAFDQYSPKILDSNTAGVHSDTINMETQSVSNPPEASRSIPPTRQLSDGPLIVAYANWNQCDDKIIDIVKDGANVIIWFSINLVVDSEGNPTVTNGPDMDCVADIVQRISAMDLQTTHLISAGGWNSPHVDTTNPIEATYLNWKNWNENIAARPQKGFYGFDGLDWDIEGNDNPDSEYNHFTVECLDAMGRFSQLAKQDGYIVSMAPAESYLDPRMGSFDRSLQHTYAEWEELQPHFAYHGLNTYAYILDRYHFTDVAAAATTTNVPASSNNATVAVTKTNTFDFVTIQLYEGYAHAEYNITIAKVAAADYLQSFVKQVTSGWTVDFSTDAELQYPQSSVISVDKTRLIVGLANGWAGDGKFLLVYPEQVQRAYELLQLTDDAPRGFAYWNILDEGISSVQRPNEPVWMARGLNKFLNIRCSTTSDISEL